MIDRNELVDFLNSHTQFIEEIFQSDNFRINAYRLGSNYGLKIYSKYNSPQLIFDKFTKLKTYSFKEIEYNKFVDLPFDWLNTNYYNATGYQLMPEKVADTIIYFNKLELLKAFK